MSANAVEFKATTKFYGSVLAVDALTLEVPEGSLYGLIGPNGAGKTTTFSLLAGFLRPTSGEIWVRGRQLTMGHPPVGQVLSLPQDASIPGRQKVRGALVHLGRLAGLSSLEAKTRAERALGKVGLDGLADRRLSQLSHGQRRRVGIAQTLIGDREVIVLDEPTAGLDPRTALELRALIADLHGDRTIVLSTHNLQDVEKLCTHAAILDKGKLITNGTMDEIRQTGVLLTVELTKPLEGADEVIKLIRGQADIADAALSSDKLALEVSLESDERVDELNTAILRVLLDHGAAVKNVHRGKSLERRFLEDTAGKS